MNTRTVTTTQWLALALTIIFASSAIGQDQTPPPTQDEIRESLAGSIFGGARSSVAPESTLVSDATAVVTPDLFSGASGSSYTIAIPSGRGAIQPQLALRYSSTISNGLVGVGWSLPTTAIYVGRASPGSVEPAFYFVDGSATTRLIPTASGEFVPQILGAHMSFKLLNADTPNASWTVIDRSGTATGFGEDNSSRRYDGAGTRVLEWRPTMTTDRAGNRARFAYRCDDSKGDANSACTTMLLPTEVLYAAHEALGVSPSVCVSFGYETRKDLVALSDWPASPRWLSQRLSRVVIRAAKMVSCSSSPIYQSYSLLYEASRGTGDSLLVSIRRSSSDGETHPVFPTFAYTQPNRSDLTKLPPPTLPAKDDFGAPSVFARLDKLHIAYADLDGNGMPEICAFGPNASRNDFFHQCATSSQDEQSSRLIPAPVSGDAMRVAGGETPYVIGVFYPDLSGDGRADICALADYAELGISLRCWMSRPGGYTERFGTPVYWARPEFRSQADVDYFATRFLSSIRFPDLNGDAASDVCWRDKSGLKCALTLSRPDGTATFQEFSGLPSRFSELEFAPAAVQARAEPLPEYETKRGAPDRYFQTLQFVDLNGDRFDDLCGRAIEGLLCSINREGKFGVVESGPAWTDAAPSTPTTPDTTDPYYTTTTDWARESHWATIRFVDLNGDSLLDVCGRDRNGIVCTLRSEHGFNEVLRGPAWADDEEYHAAPTDPKVPRPPLPPWLESKHFRSISFFDFDGDRVADACARVGDKVECHSGLRTTLGFGGVTLSFDPTAGEGDTKYATLTVVDIDGNGYSDFCVTLKAGLTCWRPYPAPIPRDLLRTITSGAGLATEVSYRLASSYPQNEVPFPHYVVAAVRTQATRPTHIWPTGLVDWGTTDLVQTIGYAGGYFSKRFGDFRGFGRVETSKTIDGRPAESVEIHFLQGALGVPAESDRRAARIATAKGKAHLVLTKDDAGNIWRELRTTYTTDLVHPFHVAPAKIASVDCAAGACDPAPMTIEYVYDDNGNAIREEHSGNPAIAEDDFTIVREFLQDVPSGIIGLPVLETTFSGRQGLRKLAQTRTIYDEPDACSGIDPVQGSLTRGRPTSILRWNDKRPGSLVRFGYDLAGNLACLRRADGGLWQYEHDAATHTAVVRTTNALGHKMEQQFVGLNCPEGKGLFGQVCRQRDANGGVLLFSYDGYGRLVEDAYPDGERRSFSYLDLGNPSKQRVEGHGGAGKFTTTWLDGSLRPWRKQNAGFGSKTVSTYHLLDGAGRAIANSSPSYDSSRPLLWETYSYDALGRLSRVTAPSGAMAHYCHGRHVTAMVGFDDVLERRTVDYFGRTLTHERYTADDKSRPSCDLSRGLPDSAVEYRYDTLGRLTKVTANGESVVDMAYDALGNRVESDHFVVGRTTFEYDASSQLVRRSTKYDKDVFFKYDLLGRMIQRDHGSQKRVNSGDEIFEYDGGALGIGRLTRVRNRSVEQWYEYDIVGRATLSGQSGAAGKEVIRRTFARGLLTELTYPDGHSLNYQYEGEYLRTVVSKDGTVRARFDDYDASGVPTKYSVGDRIRVENVIGNGDDPTCAVNGFVCRQRVLDATTDELYLEESYAYDAAGRVKAVSGPASDRLYEYDRFGNLAKIRDHDEESFAFDFDQFGNIERIRDGAGTREVSYTRKEGMPLAVAKSGSTLHSYDAGGRIVRTTQAGSAQSRVEFEHDRGVLSGIQGHRVSESYRYDALGRRVLRESGTMRQTNFSGLYDCVIQRGQKRSCSKLLRVGDSLIGIVRADGPSSSRVTSITGEHVVTHDGVRAQVLSKGPFGDGAKEALHEVEAASQIGFEDALYDPTTHLYYLGARYYDPSLTRFLTPDPIIGSATAAYETNIYAYGSNNPIRAADRDGRFIHIVIGAVVGALIAGVQSDWDLSAVMRGAVIGGISAAVGGWAAAGAGGTGVWAAAVGGAAASATSAALTGGDPLKAAAVGFISGGVGEYVSRAAFPLAGSAAAGYTGAALYGEDTSEGARWGIYGAMVAQAVVANHYDPVTEVELQAKGKISNLQRNSVYALSPSGFSRWWTVLLGDPYAHVVFVDGEGQLHDATMGRKSGIVSASELRDSYVGRSATRIGPVPVDSRPSDFHNRSYGIGSDRLVCTQFVSNATNSAFRGFLPGQMYYGANGQATAMQNYWTRPAIMQE